MLLVSPDCPRELEYLLLLSRKARNFFPEFNIRLYDKNSEPDFFFPPPKSSKMVVPLVKR